jgi:hypothetical protein
MDRIAIHLEIRNALELSDELRRHEHAAGDDELTAHLSGLLSALDELERDAGRSHSAASFSPSPVLIDAARRSVSFVERAAGRAPARLHRRIELLVASVARVIYAVERPGEPVPAKPIAGGLLPLARLVPQDAHSALDYLAGATCVASASLAAAPTARIAGALLGGSVVGASLVTDYRLAAIRLLPIEVHERLDYAWGAAAVAAPFVLGYARRAPLASALQIAAGLGTILVSLFTDYRASRGVSWRAIRSRGGPDAVGNRLPGRVDSQVQRPLEGFSSAERSGWGRDVSDFGVDPVDAELGSFRR